MYCEYFGNRAGYGDLIFITEMDSEKAVAIASKNNVDSAVVTEDYRVMGIMTTTDFFNK